MSSTVYEKERVRIVMPEFQAAIVQPECEDRASPAVLPEAWELPEEIESPFADIKEYIRSHYVGQEAAVDAVVDSLDRIGVRLDDRPVANMLFIGPTGTGKTELSKVLSDALNVNGVETNLVHLDCTALSESHDASAFLLGSPAGYVGYGDDAFFDPAKFAEKGSDKLTVLVLDEIEKADDELFKVLMPALDEGKIALKDRKVTYLSNTIIIATSNAGAAEMNKELQPALGFTKDGADAAPRLDDIEAAAKKGLQERFKQIPEFLARFNKAVVFKPHTRETLGQVMETLVRSRDEELRRRLGRGIFLADGTIDYLLDSVADKMHEGARPLKTAYENMVEGKLGRYIASGCLPKGHVMGVKATEKMTDDGKSEKKLAFYAFHAPDMVIHERSKELVAAA